MRQLNTAAAVGAAAFCAAACAPSISASPPLPLPTPIPPFPQRQRIVPRFRPQPAPLPVPLPDQHHTHFVHNPQPPVDAVAAPRRVNDGLSPAMSNGGSASTLVNRILQVALGLFVTTMELPPLPPESASRTLGYDCDFSTACRWSSVGATPERWRLARGEPDVLLWLAATGTMVLPAEPFTLIEIRGGTPVDMLSSDVIACQREAALFGFTYWTVGLSDLEICLLDLHYRQFNCTGMLQSHIQPGKVALKIPPVKHPFRIAIIPSVDQGILILDDIKYDAKYCGDTPTVIEPLPAVTSTSQPPDTTRMPGTLGLTGPTVFPFLPNPPTTTPPFPPLPTMPTLLPLTFTPVVPPFVVTSTAAGPTRMAPLPNIFTPPPPAPLTLPPPAIVVPPFGFTPFTSTVFPLTAPTSATEFPYVTPKPIVIRPEPMEPFFTTTTSASPAPFASTEAPFDLMIYGNRTSPLFDRRRGDIVQDPTDLFCDFTTKYPCLWGPNGGKWAIIEKGAIPSLEFGPTARNDLPNFPAVVAIQGPATTLTSDPLRCQSGEGKLMFRYWSNGRVLMKVCAVSFGSEGEKVQCVEEVTRTDEPLSANTNSGVNTKDTSTFAVFTLSNVMLDPFTLNIIPTFEKNARNNYLVLDEIAYLGECNLTVLAEYERKQTREGSIFGPTGSGNVRNLATPKSSGVDGGGDWSRVDSGVDGEEEADSSSAGGSAETRRPANTKPAIKIVSIQSTTSWPQRLTYSPKRPAKPNPPDDLPIGTLIPTTRRTSKGSRYPFYPTTPFIVSTTTVSTISSTLRVPTAGIRPTTIDYPFPSDRRTETTVRGSFTIPIPSTPPNNVITTEEQPVDYCKLLNCDFNENACNYLNHGMTKVPWTLKNKGYGFPLTKHTDLRPSPYNGQFVSTLLGPGDFAILESPHFNVTQGINVLLFQYYRPTHLSAIRLCLGTRYTKPYRTVASFLQCPPILRSVTSKNALKWNSVHIQLPPGTSHFYLVAHNLDRSTEKAAIAIDNIRVAICDPRNYAPPQNMDLDALESELNGSNEESDEPQDVEAGSETPKTNEVSNNDHSPAGSS